MRMFCRECGETISDNNKFCENCGTPVNSIPVQTEASAKESGQKKRGFFYSPAGIVIAAAVALAVIAGVTLGIFYLLKAGAGDEVDAATVKVWDEYEDMLEEDSAHAPQVTVDHSALVKSQEELKKEQERVAALERVLKETGGSKDRRTNSGKSTSKQDIKADQMAAALAAYNKYVQKMIELFTALDGANLLDSNAIVNLNKIIADLQKLGTQVIALSNTFLANNPKVVTTKIDPPIIRYSNTVVTELQNSVKAAEQQRLADEKAAADKAAADAAAQQAAQQQDMVACPACGGTGIREGSDSSWTCTFCDGTGRVTRAKAATYVNIE